MNKVTFKTDEETAAKNKLFHKDWLIKPEALDKKELIKISQIKRFFERWTADRDFREQVSTAPYKAFTRYNLKVEPEEVRPLWDAEFAKKYDKKAPVSTSVERFRELFLEGTKRTKLKHSLPSLSEPRFKAWRERQIARAASQFHPYIHESIVHAPMCFELSKGCSVGCWFCGISAPRLGDIFTYNQENAKLWREILALMKNILGAAAGEGFCYWATDPLDNPDYEKFCSDFHEILGIFPQTTTAQPLKDPARVRALLKLSQEKGCQLNRFSILSLKIFNQVHEEFSAEELASVDLALQNPESLHIKANAGRALERSKKKGERNNESVDNSPQTTIACVTGFLFNMVERSVKLISPCDANDRWPNGYIIYDEGTFSDINDLKFLLERMIARNMSITVRYNDLIRFRTDMKYESLPNGFQLSTKYLTRKFCNTPYLKELGEVIQKGDQTAGAIALELETFGVPRANTLHYLDFLFNKGVLDDESQPNGSKSKALADELDC
jgi:radical SAM family RiPP maturation amino acid epimerase